MIAYAERYFHLHAFEGGESKFTKLQRQLERAEDRDDKQRMASLEAELAMPPMPEELGYVWFAYMRLRRRTIGGEPIGWQDIDAFLRRAGLRLAPWEVRLLEQLDDAYLSPTTNKPPAPNEPVAAVASPQDVDGVKSILSSVGRRRVVKRKKA